MSDPRPPQRKRTRWPSGERALLVRVLTYHQRRDISSCTCGWAELGASFPEHQVEVYAQAVAAGLEPE